MVARSGFGRLESCFLLLDRQNRVQCDDCYDGAALIQALSKPLPKSVGLSKEIAAKLLCIKEGILDL